MRVPTIAWWPGQVPAGTSTDVIAAMFDVLPTFAALAGTRPPADRRLDGVDLWPHLTGDPAARPAHETFYYFRGLRLEAVRHGDWKLVVAAPDPVPGAKKQPPPFQRQLYHLGEDIGETRNVIAAHPDVEKKLQALVEAMKDDLGLDGIGPGCRELGRVADPKPILPAGS